MTEIEDDAHQVAISTLVERCLVAFREVVTTLNNPLSSFFDELAPSQVEDELERFKIWAGNVAAHRKGRRSLQFRLRDASHLKERVSALLVELEAELQEMLSILKEERIPWDQVSDSDTDSDSSSIQSVAVVRKDDILQGDTELKQLRSGIAETITCLLRLSISIRNPAPHTQFLESIDTKFSYFEPFDIEHVRAKFPGSGQFRPQEYLVQRLGKAISRRRQYLKYRERHHMKLSEGIETAGLGSPDSSSEQTTDSTVATPLPAGLKDKGAVNTEELVLEDDRYSHTSYTTSINYRAVLKPPPLPKEALDSQPFQCPLCFMIITTQSTHGWRVHVYRDLFPYVCTVQGCLTPDRLYESQHEWFKHELTNHRRLWQCAQGCHQSFDDEKIFRKHLQREHLIMSTNVEIAAMVNLSQRALSPQTKLSCPLCSYVCPTVATFQKHVGQHQLQLALFALPPNVGQDEDQEELELPEGAISDRFSTKNSSFGSENEIYEDLSRPSETRRLLKRLSRIKRNLPPEAQSHISTLAEQITRKERPGSDYKELVRQIEESIYRGKDEMGRELTKDLGNLIAQSDHQGSQIGAASPLEAPKSERGDWAREPLSKSHTPTFVKMHRDHISRVTLEYYNLPWEVDKNDSEYIIVLRELDRQETDRLFEHTRALRLKKPGSALEPRQTHSHQRPPLESARLSTGRDRIPLERERSLDFGDRPSLESHYLSLLSRFSRDRSHSERDRLPLGRERSPFGRDRPATKERLPLQSDAQQRTIQKNLQQPSKYVNSPKSNEPLAEQRMTLLMPDKIRWFYRDPQGYTQGPWSGLEMHDWYKAGFFPAGLPVRKHGEDYEPLAQVIRRIGNSREPFLVPQMGIPYVPP